MRYSKAILISFAAFFFQGSLINLFSIFGTTPNLLLCVIVLFAFLYEENDYGMILGVVFGLLYDICYMPYVGVSALWLFLIAFGVSLTRELLNRENIGTILIITAVATFVFNMMTWFTYFIMGSNTVMMYALKAQPLSIIYNIAIEALLYAAVIKKVLKRRRDLFYQ